jgi:hypothetical protein
MRVFSKTVPPSLPLLFRGLTICSRTQIKHSLLIGGQLEVVVEAIDDLSANNVLHSGDGWPLCQ